MTKLTGLETLNDQPCHIRASHYTGRPVLDRVIALDDTDDAGRYISLGAHDHDLCLDDGLWVVHIRYGYI